MPNAKISKEQKCIEKKLTGNEITFNNAKADAYLMEKSVHFGLCLKSDKEELLALKFVIEKLILYFCKINKFICPVALRKAI